jgi:hypothetical protein
MYLFVDFIGLFVQLTDSVLLNHRENSATLFENDATDSALPRLTVRPSAWARAAAFAIPRYCGCEAEAESCANASPSSLPSFHELPRATLPRARNSQALDLA